MVLLRALSNPSAEDHLAGSLSAVEMYGLQHNSWH